MAGYTSETSCILDLARQEAKRLGYPFIQREQLFLGLLRSEDVSPVLKMMGLDQDVVRSEIERRLIPGMGAPDDETSIGMLPTAEQIYLHRAQTAAALMGHTEIRPEHILLGFLLEQHGVVLEVLTAQGVTKEHVMDAIKRLDA